MKQINTWFVLLIATCLSGGYASAQENNLMLVNARTLINTPYVARTLEGGDEEKLVINCDEVDCTTFVEYTLAMSLCSTQGKEMHKEEFAKHLQRIRYRNGKIDGYTSRLHYISDWADNGIRNGFLEDITASHVPYTQKLSLSYMSTHPQLYQQLAHSPENVAKMRHYEQILTDRDVHWIPKAEVPIEGVPYIQNGDIIAITTHIPGLDVAHMGIAIYVEGKLCLIHASSNKQKVLVEELTLNQLLAINSKWTGIRVFRLKK